MAPGSKPSTPLNQPNGVLALRAPSGASSTRAASPMTAKLTTAVMAKPAPAANSSGSLHPFRGSETDLEKPGRDNEGQTEGNKVDNPEEGIRAAFRPRQRDRQ